MTHTTQQHKRTQIKHKQNNNTPKTNINKFRTIHKHKQRKHTTQQIKDIEQQNKIKQHTTHNNH